jgi:hypothetical protein
VGRLSGGRRPKNVALIIDTVDFRNATLHQTIQRSGRAAMTKQCSHIKISASCGLCFLTIAHIDIATPLRAPNASHLAAYYRTFYCLYSYTSIITISEVQLQVP